MLWLWREEVSRAHGDAHEGGAPAREDATGFDGTEGEGSGRGCGAQLDGRADADRIGCTGRTGRLLWLLVGLVVAAAVAVTVDRTVFSGGTDIPTTSSIAPVDSTHRVVADDVAAAVVAKYRERIPELMAEQGIPGLAVALVDKDRTVWLAGFGRLDDEGSAPVNADTIFSVQSMSKLFTATAVMQAVAAGRLDLDEPITTYLPGFTVHSAFEEHPERKITLRMLLSHTAGFTQEAPVGNSNELDPGDFDAHVRSISQTWLRFPVGTGLAYSNLGIDLAGYILERVEGKPFPEVARESLLEPLGMGRSTFDRAAIRASGNRAVGHGDVEFYPSPPLYEPMTAAGGLYTSARDLARFLRFQLNGGSLDGRVVLDRRWLDEMRTVPPPRAGAAAGYALGVVRHRWNTWPDLFEHGGGGNGFLADLWWAPEVGIGIAVLTNSPDHQLQNELSTSILIDLLREPGAYRDRALAFSGRAGVEDANVDFAPPAGLASLVADAAMPARGDEATRWAGYSGLYRTLAWDVLEIDGPPARFLVDAGVPYFEGEDRNEVVRSPSPRRDRARPVPGRRRRDARPPGTRSDLAELPARSRLGRPLSMAVGDPRGGRARRAHLARRRAAPGPSGAPPPPEPRPPVGVGSPRRSQVQPRWSCSQPWHCSRGCPGW